MRHYFMPFGISWHSCSKPAQPVAATDQAKGDELKILLAAIAPSLRQTAPAKTIEQNIKTTTQGLGR
jgi:hypothetical protein